MKKLVIFIIFVVAILIFSKYSLKRNKFISGDTVSMITILNKEYVAYMPVAKLPEEYHYLRDLDESEANDTGLEGCRIFVNPGDALLKEIYLYQECGTSINENIADSAKLQYAYVKWIRKDLYENKNKLTLDIVKELSKKGDSLSWSDFEDYDSTEAGSGLYIRIYDIDENYQLWIGGGSTDDAPMYIRLVSINKEHDDKYIDIRNESIEDFINS